MGQTRPASAESAVMGERTGVRVLNHNSISYFVVKDGTNILQYQSQILTSRATANIHERNPCVFTRYHVRNKHIDSMPSEMFIATQDKWIRYILLSRSHLNDAQNQCQILR